VSLADAASGIRRAWDVLQSDYVHAAEGFARDPQDAAFARGRLEEGRAIGAFLLDRFPSRHLDVLDLGSGNGGVSLAIANYRNCRVVSLDTGIHPLARTLAKRTASPVEIVAGDGVRTPFADECFDLVLCLELVEHVPEPGRLGAEVMRILRPGGACMVTTPPRLPHLFAPDPHFGIPGLLLLPDRLQRLAATRLWKRVPPGAYDVRHIYAYAGSIARLFPGHAGFQAIDSSTAWPPVLRDRFAWKRLLLRKEDRPAGR